MSETRQRPIEETCYWLATRGRTGETPAGAGASPPDGKASHAGLPSRTADVAVIGAGFTGLWCALALMEIDPGLDVVVLDQGAVGFGASGRNAGIVGETIDHGHGAAIAHFGEVEARRLAVLGRENLDELDSFLESRGIDAAFERTGQLIFALTPAHMADLETAVASAHRLGVRDWRLLDAGQARREIHSDLYLGAALAPRAGIVHPVRLLDGLCREAERLGVRFHERTPVERIVLSGEDVELRTGTGGISARRVILATNAWSHTLVPRLRHRLMPLYDYIMVSEPLTPAQREAIGWADRQGATDARAFFNYYRLTPDGRILWGTSEALYYPPGRVDPDCDHSPPHYASLAESFRRHFPLLRDLVFPWAWGGPIGSTTRLTPFFGSMAAGRLVYGLGFTGHGIGTTRIAGKVLAHMALGADHPLLGLAMVRRKPLPYPPGPLRTLAVRAVTRSLRRVDGGGRRGLLLRALEAAGIGFSS